MSKHECNERSKRYEVSGDGKARLIPCCPDCGGLLEKPPVESRTCESEGCGCCCASRCLVLPDGGIWGVTLERAKEHFAKKLRDQVQEAFKLSCGPSYDKVKRLREKMEDPSLFGLLAGMFFGLVSWVLVLYNLDPTGNDIHSMSSFFLDGTVGLFVGGGVCWLIHHPFWETKQKKIVARLQQLGVQPTGPSEKWEDYLDQVKIEVAKE